MNLLLVFGLDVPVEGTRLAERLVAMRTLISPFTTMDSFDMPLEVTSSREWLRTLWTAKGFLPGVDSEVLFEVRESLKCFLTKRTDPIHVGGHQALPGPGEVTRGVFGLQDRNHLWPGVRSRIIPGLVEISLADILCSVQFTLLNYSILLIWNYKIFRMVSSSIAEW